MWRYLTTANAVGAELSTWNLTLAQALPADPDEDCKSRVKESQLPTVEGAEMDTTGVVGFRDRRIGIGKGITVVQLLHRAGMREQDALIEEAVTLTYSPGIRATVASGNTVRADPSADH